MKYTEKPTRLMRTQYPEAWSRYAELAGVVDAAPDEVVVPPSASSVADGSAVVVPLGRVPFNTIVLVPLTSTTLISDLLRPAYEPSPIKLSKNVVSPLSSHPQTAYSAQRQSTGFVSLAPVSCLATRFTSSAYTTSRRVLV